MEESINWPDPDDQETFEKQLLGSITWGTHYLNHLNPLLKPFKTKNL